MVSIRLVEIFIEIFRRGPFYQGEQTTAGFIIRSTWPRGPPERF